MAKTDANYVVKNNISIAFSLKKNTTLIQFLKKILAKYIHRKTISTSCT